MTFLGKPLRLLKRAGAEAAKPQTNAAVTLDEDRPLTDEENRLLRWMLENGGPEAQPFLPQLSHVRVSGRCSCGCATVDLRVDNALPVHHSRNPIADFISKDEAGHLLGLMVLAADGHLSCMEIYSIDGEADPSVLPPIETLEPFAEGS